MIQVYQSGTYTYCWILKLFGFITSVFTNENNSAPAFTSSQKYQIVQRNV